MKKSPLTGFVCGWGLGLMIEHTIHSTFGPKYGWIGAAIGVVAVFVVVTFETE
jgi:hypothetical protein